MESDPHRRPVYEFGEFRVESEHLMLYRDGEEVGVPPKAVETLLALVKKRNQIVSKNDLMDAIWADTAVEESNLSRYIHILRSTLGNQPSGKPYIETLRRRGYRFTGDVRILEPHLADGAKEVNDGRNDLVPIGRVLDPTSPGHYPTVSTRSGNVVAVAMWQRPSEDEQGAPVEAPASSSPESTRARIQKADLLFASLGVIAVIALAYFLITDSFQPPLTDKDVVLVADFDNQTGEEIFDKTLRLGLSIQLQQSPFLSLFPDDRIQETLRLMKREGLEKITPELAREICIRQGLKAYISGSIARLGESYVISIAAINSDTGESIASEQAEASKKEEIFPALSGATVAMRKKLGESLASIQSLGRPLEATTSSLEALRAYSLGRSQLDAARFEGALPFLKRAVEFDPNFAVAFMDLALAYHYGNMRDRTDSAILRAYELRNSVSDRERLQITDQYHNWITGDNDARVETLTLLRQLYPRDVQAHAQLARVRAFRGEYEDALTESETAVEMGDLRSWNVRVQSLVSLGRFAEALASAEQGIATGMNPTDLRLAMASVKFASGDTEGAEAEIDQIPREDLKPLVTLARADMDIFRGRFRSARKTIETAIETAKRGGVRERLALTYAEAGLELGLAGDCDEALRFAATGLETDEYPPIPGTVASTLGWCGDDKKAMEVMERLAKRFPNGTLQTRQIIPMINASGAFKRGEFDKVIEDLNSIPPGFERRSGFKVKYLRGRAFVELGRNDEAINEFRRIIENRHESLLSPLFLFAHLEAARAYARAGDTANARSYYEKFLELWKDADPDLVPLIEAKREFGKLNENS